MIKSKNNIRHNFGRLLAEERLRLKYGINKVSAKTGLNVAEIDKIELGKGNSNWVDVLKLLKFYKIKIDFENL